MTITSLIENKRDFCKWKESFDLNVYIQIKEAMFCTCLFYLLESESHSYY